MADNPMAVTLRSKARCCLSRQGKCVAWSFAGGWGGGIWRERERERSRERERNIHIEREEQPNQHSKQKSFIIGTKWWGDPRERLLERIKCMQKNLERSRGGNRLLHIISGGLSDC